MAVSKCVYGSGGGSCSLAPPLPYTHLLTGLVFSTQRVKGLKGFESLASFYPLTLYAENPMRFVTHFALLASRFAGLATNHFPQPITDV
jgi:hypothetical protein